MLVLIDESGDPGFKLDKGSSQHFVIAMVIFEDYKQAEACSSAIAAERARLNIRGEFKFNKTSASNKDAFFAAIKPFKFCVRALVVDKTKIYSPNLRSNDERFYNYFVQSLLRGDGGTLNQARIKIDGSGDREFQQELLRYLKRRVPAGAIESVKLVDSQKDNLIQLADMVVGAIARSFKPAEERNKACRWREALGGKIKDLWEFK